MDESEAMEALESNFNLAMHEAVHAVLLRAQGHDVEIVDGEEGPTTNRIFCWEPCCEEWMIMSIMGPEVYMTDKGHKFTERSVSHDRKQVNEKLQNGGGSDEDKLRLRHKLIEVFACPFIDKAINTLEDNLSNGDRVNLLPHSVIQSLIDHILIRSPYAYGLRERLQKS